MTTNLFSNTEIDSQALEAKSPEPRCQHHLTPSRGSRGKSTLCLFQLPVAANVPWLVVASLQPLPLSSHGLIPSVCVSVCIQTAVLLQGHQSFDSGPTESSINLSQFILSAKNLFSKEAPYNESGDFNVYCVCVCLCVCVCSVMTNSLQPHRL